MKRLTEEQRRVLGLMQKRPESIYCAADLNCTTGTLYGLRLRGVAARQGGAWWRLTQAGKDFELP